MKKVLQLILFTLFSFTAFSQNFVSDNYQDFLEADNSTVVQVHGITFQMAAEVISELENEEIQEYKEVISSIKSFQLVAMPDLENPKGEYTNGVRKIGNAYDELVSVKDKDNRFSVHIDEENGIVYEIVGLGTEADEGRFIAFSLVGEIPLDMIGEIMNKVQNESGSKISNIFEDKNIEITNLNVYPNPASVDNSLTVDIPESLIGGEGMFVDFNGKVISKFEINNQTKELQTTGLTPGYYLVSLTKDGTTVKRKVNVIR